MRYQVFNGMTKRVEFDAMCEVLAQYGVSTTPDREGRTGVVDDASLAAEILAAIRARVRWLHWQIIELPALPGSA